MTPPPPQRHTGAPVEPPKPPFRVGLSGPRGDRAEATFKSAIERPEEERTAFVRGACGEDEELQQRVSELLAAHQLQDGLETEEGASTPAIEAALARLKPEKSGDRIGQYKLLQAIGVVWMAEQEHPVVQRVALRCRRKPARFSVWRGITMGAGSRSRKPTATSPSGDPAPETPSAESR